MNKQKVLFIILSLVLYGCDAGSELAVLINEFIAENL
tara:strand:- start:1316 stop:1426 length:111 start_codon:yes stop_codon:yes gene_type:complete